MSKYLNTKKGSLEESIIGLVETSRSVDQMIEKKLDEISPELAKRAFDARAKKHKAAMGSAAGWDKRADKDAAKGDTRGASAARSIAKDKEREAGDMEKKMDRSAKKAGVDAQDRYNKATDDRSPNQKYTDYKKKGGDLSFQDYKKKYLKQDFDPIDEEKDTNEGLFDKTGDKVAKAKRALAGGMPKHVVIAKYHVTSKDLGEEKDDDKKLDKVNPKALKKDFDDREDQDLDNDGDVDDSDEYLHKRRQTVSKSVNKEEFSMVEAAVKHITAMWEKAAPKTEEEHDDEEEKVKGSKTMTGKPKSKVEVDPEDVEDKNQ